MINRISFHCLSPRPNRLLATLTTALIWMVAGSAIAQDQTRYWNLSWSWEKVDVEKLIDRLDSVGLEIPVDAKGQATVDVQVGIPLNALRSPEKYRLKGKIDSDRLVVDKLVCTKISASIDVAGGVAKLTNLQTTLGSVANDGSGSVNGSAQLQFAPAGRLMVDLAVDELNIRPLHQVFLASIGSSGVSAFAGRVDGRVKFSAPFDALSDVAKWSLDGNVSLQNFRSGQFPPINLKTGPVTISEGDLQARDVLVAIEEQTASSLRLAAHAELKGQRRFDVAVVGDDVPVAEIAGLFSTGSAPLASGQLDLNLKAKGKFGNGELAAVFWQVEGALASPALTVAGVDLGLLEHTVRFDRTQLEIKPASVSDQTSLKLNRVAANYAIEAEGLTLESLEADVFGGTISGNAVLSLVETGRHHVDLKWNDLSLAANSGTFTPVGVKISANTSGAIDWDVPVLEMASVDQHRGTLDVRLSEVRMGDASVGEIAAVLRAKEDTLDVEAEGRLLGGDLVIRISNQLAPGITWQQLFGASTTGQVAISGVQASKVFSLIPMASKPGILTRRWEAKLSGKLDFAPSESGDFQIVSNLLVRNLQLDGDDLAQRLEASTKLVDGRIVLDRIIGLVAGGRVDANGHARLDLDSGRFGDAQILARLDRLDLSDLLRPVSKGLSEQFVGNVSGRITVSGGDRNRWTFRGASRFADASFFGLRVEEAHGSLSGWVTNAVDRWRFDLNSISGVAGDGRLSGDLTLKSANHVSKVDMRSHWKMQRVDFAKVIRRGDAASGAFGDGRLSGDLTLNANRISGPHDLYGNFDFELGGSEAGAIPGLSGAQNLLGPVSLAGVRFDEGQARGVIGGGRATIQEFWLHSPQVMVWAEGAVLLANQRLDLEAVIATGNFDVSSTLLSTLGLVAIEYATPIGLLIEINKLLSNRMVFLDVVGPGHDPELRLKPLETIREAAAMFFLQQLLPISCSLPQQRNPLAR